MQNIILACRAFGLGTLITTHHIRCEGEVKALLGIPEDVLTYALKPIGYPEAKFGSVRRRAVNEVAYTDRWGCLEGLSPLDATHRLACTEIRGRR